MMHLEPVSPEPAEWISPEPAEWIEMRNES